MKKVLFTIILVVIAMMGIIKPWEVTELQFQCAVVGLATFATAMVWLADQQRTRIDDLTFMLGACGDAFKLMDRRPKGEAEGLKVSVTFNGGADNTFEGYVPKVSGRHETLFRCAAAEEIFFATVLIFERPTQLEVELRSSEFSLDYKAAARNGLVSFVISKEELHRVVISYEVR